MKWEEPNDEETSESFVSSEPAVITPTPIVNNSETVRTAGQLALYYKEWKNLTKDKLVLSLVKGYELPFDREPSQPFEPSYSKLSLSEIELVNQALDGLLNSGAIVKAVDSQGQFISKVFTVPKPDGSARPVINLRKMKSAKKT